MGCTEKRTPSVTFLPKMYTLNVIMKKKIRKPIGVIVYKTTDQSVLFKTVEVMKVKERFRNCQRLEVKEKEYNTIKNPGLDPEAEKGH